MNTYQEVEKYKKSIVKNNVFMMDSVEEEIKYIDHNKYRFIEALDVLDIIFSNKNKLNLLDIGTSPFTFILKNRYKNARIYTIDVTNKFETLCHAKGVIFKKVDLSKDAIPFKKGLFDIISFLEVIEHIDVDHMLLLLKIAEIMAVNGFCILQTPNKYSPKSLVSNFLGLKFWEIFSDTPVVGKEFEHVKEYSLKEITYLINKMEVFEVVEKKHSMYFDEIKSAIVYRNNTKTFVPLITLNYYLVKNISFLRRGMQIILKKNEN